MTLAPATDDALAADLRDRISGTVALPGELDYQRILPWNVAVPVAPCAAVFATSAADIAATVRYASERGLTVAVQSTGHGALSVGPETILVSTADMQGCAVDALNRVARVEAGVTWQRVLDAATPFGLAPLCGSSPNVGVVGFLTGGGIGPLVRSVGVSSDYVRAFEIVTGAGDVLRVTPDQHGDLFWGLRGSKATLDRV